MTVVENINRAARRTFKTVADRVDRDERGRSMRYTAEPGHFVDLWNAWTIIRERRPTDDEACALLKHMQDSAVLHGLATDEEMSAIRVRYEVGDI